MNVHSKTRDSAKPSTRYSFDNVRERTVHLIRACVVIMQACQNEMPESYDVSLRLYYNEGKILYSYSLVINCFKNMLLL